MTPQHMFLTVLRTSEGGYEYYQVNAMGILGFIFLKKFVAILYQVPSWTHTGWGKSRFTAAHKENNTVNSNTRVNSVFRKMRNEFIFVLLFINYCIIFHTNDCTTVSLLLPHPVFIFITLHIVKRNLFSSWQREIQLFISALTFITCHTIIEL